MNAADQSAMHIAAMSSSQENWFEDGAPPEGLRPQEEINKKHAKFRRRLGIASNSKRAAEVESTKNGLLRQIEEARNHDLPRTAALEGVGKASAAHSTYSSDRETGSKRRRNSVQANAEVLLSFVERFSKVIDAVATAGGPYGSVAYETLSIMVAIVQNKVDNDNKVVGMLDEIQKALPELATWEQIYPTEKMRSLIVKVYVHITKFSARAAEYFTHFRMRIKLAIFPGFVTGFDDINANIRITLADINSATMYGLHQRIHKSGEHIEQLREQADKAELAQQELLTKNGELLTQNKSLERELEQLRVRADVRDKQEDDRRLQQFSDFLGVPLNHPGTMVDATKKTLMQVFPDITLNPRKVPCTGYWQASREQLYRSDEYRTWHGAKEPSLLFISGGTHWYGRNGVGFIHCWLSPFTIYLAEDASRERNAIVTFFSALSGLDPEPISASTVIASIILQLIQRSPQMLREKDDEFRRVVSRPADNSWSTKSLVDLLGRVLSQLGGDGEAVIETVYIVIDRFDLCTPNNLSEAMASLLHMVTTLRQPPVGVKVAVVAETSGGNAEWHSEFLPELEFDPHRLVVLPNWIQEKFASWQSHIASRPIWSSNPRTEES